MDETQGETGPDTARIALIVCCALAALLAALLVGAFGSGGLAGSPMDAALPGEHVYDEYMGDPTEEPLGDSGGGPGGFGALNPGDSTGVGGDTGLDRDTFGNNDTDVHFTVESSQPAYWRTGAYESYTGTGWRASGDTASYEEPIEHDGIDDEQISYEITLNRSASSLPTAWRPIVVDGVDGKEVTDQGAIHLNAPVEEGTTFTGVSYAPERDLDVLRASGQTYPDEIEDVYTDLPFGETTEIGRFTDELTDDAENPYEVARTIEQWLRAEKDYSLQASSSGERVAHEFIFEMDEGYCEYFATAMTVMLRTQGIPARYAVGYTNGQAVGDGVYEVRGMNAHAWVEVYFEDVGWVRFDPTPGGDRLETEQAALDEHVDDDDFDLEDVGSPGETFRPGEINASDEFGPENDIDPGEFPEPGEENGESDEGYDISLDGPAVPGEEVNIVVTEDGDPLRNMGVAVNGEQVGTTGGDGMIRIIVPDEDELHVELTGIEDPFEDIFEDGPSDDDIDDVETFESEHSPETRGTQLVLTDRQTTDVSSQELESEPNDDSLGNDSEETSETFPVETDATITVSGDEVPGGEIIVTVAVAGTPVADGVVNVNGERVGVTDTDGQMTVTLPDTTGEVLFELEHDTFEGQTTVNLPELELEVDATLPVALPFSTVTAEVTRDDEALAGAPVELDGEHVATTGTDGTATLRLPFTSSATASVSDGSLSEETTIDGLIRNLLGVLAVFGITLGGVAYAFWRSRFTVAGIASTIRRLPALVVSYGTWLLVTVATNSDSIVESGRERIARAVQTVVAFLSGQFSLAELRERIRTSLSGNNADTTGSTGIDGSDTSEDTAYVTVRDAWERFLVCVSTSDTATQTPGELATHAIEHDGLPREAVGTLRDVFREVEYGSREATDRLAHVQAAIEDIEREMGEEATYRSDERSSSGGSR